MTFCRYIGPIDIALIVGCCGAESYRFILILPIIACGGVHIIKLILYSMIVITFRCMDYSRLWIFALALYIIRWYICSHCNISAHLCETLFYFQLISSVIFRPYPHCLNRLSRAFLVFFLVFSSAFSLFWPDFFRRQ